MLPSWLSLWPPATELSVRPARRKSVAVHCCERMRQQVEWVCERHPDRFDCPDCLVHYAAVLREYGLIVHDGGSSVVRIEFCPWCGAKLPESQRGSEQLA